MHPDADTQEQVYRVTAERGRPPLSIEVAEALDRTPSQVLAAFRRLQERRLLALAPETGEIVMAPPFSAVPTPFRVLAGERSYFANCVWDALGVAAALHADAVVETSCACCGEPRVLRVQGGAPPAVPDVAHFAVPAADWWYDIAYT